MAEGKEYIANTGADGSVSISEDVVGIIALEALREVEGCGGVLNTLSSDLADLFSKKSGTRGVQVSTENGSVTLDICVSVRYGYSIVKVSRTIQDVVQKAVSDMTGIPVAAVNVHVGGVTFDKVKQ